MDYFIPIYYAKLIDVNARINSIFPRIQEYIIQFNLLSKPITHKQCTAFIYHCLIEELCKEAVETNMRTNRFVYCPSKLSYTKLNSLFDSKPREVKAFLLKFLQSLKEVIGIDIIEYTGGAKQLYKDYIDNSGAAVSALTSINKITVKSNKQKQLKFFERYGLKHLYENHFKNINYLILTVQNK